jgi:ankyrin repeat protein
MKLLQTISLLAVLAFQAAALAQNPTQSLNDQLWEAARKGDAAAVTALLDKGADVNAKFRYGTTALFKAAERGNTEVVNVLLARGADVTVKDTFYGTTAMTWALDHNHEEIVRAILDKSPQDADDVLLKGARENKPGLVRIALAKSGATPGALTTALVAATSSENKNDELIDLLKKAGAVPAPEIDVDIVQTYIGKYKSDQGRDIEIALKDGKVVGIFGGQSRQLMAVDQTSFKPVAFDGLTITFKQENSKVTGFDLKQGPTTTFFKRAGDQ